MMATRTFSFWYRLPPLLDGAWPMCEDKFVNLRLRMLRRLIAPQRRRRYTAPAARTSCERTWKMRWSTVTTDSPAST